MQKRHKGKRHQGEKHEGLKQEEKERKMCKRGVDSEGAIWHVTKHQNKQTVEKKQ